MEETIELRLARIAQKVADMYKDRIEPKYYKQLCNAIEVCRDYHINNKENWTVMYDAVLYDGGIWEYGTGYPGFDGEIEDMWILETDILSCNCYLGCEDNGDTEPEDLEIRGENIPRFVELLEKLINETNKVIDYDKIFEYWGSKICY